MTLRDTELTATGYKSRIIDVVAEFAVDRESGMLSRIAQQIIYTHTKILRDRKQGVIPGHRTSILVL